MPVVRPIEYLQMHNVQRIAALFGHVFNVQDVSRHWCGANTCLEVKERMVA